MIIDIELCPHKIGHQKGIYARSESDFLDDFLKESLGCLGISAVLLQWCVYSGLRAGLFFIGGDDVQIDIFQQSDQLLS